MLDVTFFSQVGGSNVFQLSCHETIHGAPLGEIRVGLSAKDAIATGVKISLLWLTMKQVHRTAFPHRMLDGFNAESGTLHHQLAVGQELLSTHADFSMSRTLS